MIIFLNIFLQVKWSAPEDDGGAEVKEYKLEMRDADKRAWNEVAKCRYSQSLLFQINICTL